MAKKGWFNFCKQFARRLNYFKKMICVKYFFQKKKTLKSFCFFARICANLQLRILVNFFDAPCFAFVNAIFYFRFILKIDSAHIPGESHTDEALSLCDMPPSLGIGCLMKVCGGIPNHRYHCQCQPTLNSN